MDEDPDATPIPGPPGGVLGQALRGQRGPVALASALVTVHQTLEVLVPVTIGVIIDRAIAPGDGGQAVRWLAVLAAQFVVLSASGCVALYVDERARKGAVHATRVAVARRVLDAGGGVEQALPGEVVSLSTVETTRIGQGVGAVIVGIGAVTGVLAGAAILLLTSVWLGLVVVVGLPVVLLAVDILAQPLVHRADEHQRAVGAASGAANDLLHGLRVLKGLGADAAASARYRRASGAALDAGLAANGARSRYHGITVTFASSFIIVVAWLGARLALDGQLSVGQLVAAFGVTQFLVGPFARLAFASGELAQARAAAEHLDAALAAPVAVVGGDLAPPAGGPPRLRLEGLLAGVSVTAEPGATVGVVADHGDAEALVAVLERSTAAGGGRVVLDDVDHEAMSLDDARRTVVVAHHDAPLFPGTLRANIESTGGRADRTVTEAACLADVVASVEGGLDGETTDAGRSLSGGQRQRVALARALAAGAPVLVLHEPTTAVDTATEHRIARALRAARAGGTTVIITASPTLLARADHVVLVQDGRVVAEGTHHELLDDDRYREAVLR